MRQALHFTHLVLVCLPADVSPAYSLHLHDDLLDLLVSDLLQDTDGASLRGGSRSDILTFLVVGLYCTHLEEDFGVSEPPAVVEGLVLLENCLGARLQNAQTMCTGLKISTLSGILPGASVSA